MAQTSNGGGPRRPDVPSAAQYAGLGATLAGAIVLFTLLGSWVDGRWGTGPWGVLVGVFAGFGLGLAWLFRQAAAAGKRRHPEER